MPLSLSRPAFSALRMVLTAGTSLLALTLAAEAQEAPTELEELVVKSGSGGTITAEGYVGTASATGAKVDTPFLETPQSISSVTESQLKKLDQSRAMAAILW